MKKGYKKQYWINYLGFWVIFISASLIFSYIDHYDGGPLVNLNFRLGFIITSIISSFVLGHLIAKKYAINEKFDELRQKEGLTYQEFNLKYGKIFEIIDNVKVKNKNTKEELEKKSKKHLSKEGKEALIKFLRKTGPIKD